MRFFFMIIVSTLISATAWAVEPIPAAAPTPQATDLTQILKDGKGVAFKDDMQRDAAEARADPKCDKCPDMTLGHALSAALRFAAGTDPEIAHNAIQKAILAHYADLCDNEKTIALTNHQIEQIKKALNQTPLSGPVIESVLKLVDPNGLDAAIKADAAK